MKEKPCGIPLGIWLIIIWLGLNAFSRIIWIRLFLYPDISMDEILPYFIADIIVFLVVLVIIYGLFKASSWAWVLLIAMIVIDIVTSFAISSTIGAVIPTVRTIFGIIVIIYLLKPGVKSYFKLV